MPKKSDDLLNEIIQRRKAQPASRSRPIRWRSILDDLNAMDALDGLRRRATLCYGPKVIQSALPSLGVVIWQRPPAIMATKRSGWSGCGSIYAATAKPNA